MRKVEQMRLLLALALLTSVATSGSAAAEQYPVRPIKVVVPFAAAGVQDVVTRIVFEKGLVAAGAAGHRREPAGRGRNDRDGVCGCIAGGRLYARCERSERISAGGTEPLPELSYHPVKSFEPIAMVGSSGAVLSVGKDFRLAISKN